MTVLMLEFWPKLLAVVAAVHFPSPVEVKMLADVTLTRFCVGVRLAP